MYANYQLKAEEFDLNFFNSIKETFKGKDVDISINDYDETEYLLRSPKNRDILLERMKNVEEGKNLITFSLEEFEKLYASNNI